MESRILSIGIQKYTAQGIWNPTNNWNPWPETSSTDKYWNPVPGIWIQNWLGFPFMGQ